MVKIRKQIETCTIQLLMDNEFLMLSLKEIKSHSKSKLVKENLCKSLGKMLYPRWMQQKI